jgi:hypothetical protein
VSASPGNGAAWEISDAAAGPPSGARCCASLPLQHQRARLISRRCAYRGTLSEDRFPGKALHDLSHQLIGALQCLLGSSTNPI